MLNVKNSELQISEFFTQHVHSPGIIESSLVFPAILVLIRIALSLHGTASAKMPFGQKASLFKKIKFYNYFYFLIIQVGTIIQYSTENTNVNRKRKYF